MTAFDPKQLLDGILADDFQPSTPAKAAKPAKVTLFHAPRSGVEWCADDWRAFYHERAGIREFQGLQSRPEAERLAAEDCIAQWRALHPMSASEPQDGCIRCHSAAGDVTLVPHLAAAGKAYFWLHRECWPAFDAERRQAALSVLSAMIPDIFGGA